MLNRRGFLKGIFGAVALIAAAPALRVADAVIPGPPPPNPGPKICARYDLAMALKATDRGPLPVGTVRAVSLPVPDGWILCDGREFPKGLYLGTENYLRSFGPVSFPYGSSAESYRVPDFRGRYPHE